MNSKNNARRCPEPWGGVLGIYAKSRRLGFSLAPARRFRTPDGVTLPSLDAQNVGAHFCASNKNPMNFAGQPIRNPKSTIRNRHLLVVVFHGLPSSPAKDRVQEALNVTIQHIVKVALLILRTGILHALVRMQKVIADLRA